MYITDEDVARAATYRDHLEAIRELHMEITDEDVARAERYRDLLNSIHEAHDATSGSETTPN